MRSRSPRTRSSASRGTELYSHLLDHKSHFLYVQRFADPKLATMFIKKGFAGVNSYPEEKRAYPGNGVAAPVIGYAGTDDTGLGGLELQYNSRLQGHAGAQTIVRDPFGRAIDVLSSTAVREGNNVFTTIDHTIQANAEQVLRQTVAQWGAQSATAVVMDPKTGEVLAMAQAPGYNANDAGTVPPALQRNRSVTDVYEPGSTFKLVTVSAALSLGLVSPETKFVLPGVLHVADRTIHDAEPRGTETMTVAQILARSSNIGAITIAQKLGAPALMEWINKFGFGAKTGIDFPGESSGLVLPLDKWSGSTIGNVPIGQGIAVTPIQLASAYSAIANGGVWIQPHLVSRIGGHEVRGLEHRRLVSPQVDDALKAMLTGVVDEHGATGNEARIPGYSVAGKTGTGADPRPARLLRVERLHGLVRRHGSRRAPAPRRARRRRPPARLHLRRRRRRPGVRRRSRSSTSSTWPSRRPPRGNPSDAYASNVTTPQQEDSRWTHTAPTSKSSNGSATHKS